MDFINYKGSVEANGVEHGVYSFNINLSFKIDHVYNSIRTIKLSRTSIFKPAFSIKNHSKHNLAYM